MDWSSDDLRLVDGELCRLARCEAQLRLRIGDVLEALFAQMGHHELGFSTQKAYTLERISRSGRWAAETRAMARRLAPLPRTRAALERGDIGWSMAELLSRNATSEDERLWLRAARGRRVHEMREAVRSAKGEPAAAAEDEDDDHSILTVTLPPHEALDLEAVQMVLEHLEGDYAARDWVEMLLAEGLCGLLAHHDGKPLETDEDLDDSVLGRTVGRSFEGVGPRVDLWSTALGLDGLDGGDGTADEGDEKTAADEAPATGEGEPGAEPCVEPWDFGPLPATILELDAHLRSLSAQLASRDLWLGEMLSRFVAAKGWRRLGYASETEYARERLGMSRASMRGRIALARGASSLEPLGEAVRNGVLGTEAARLIARVARPGNVSAWVERAERRTFKHLREETRAAELFGRYAGWTDENTAPPDEEDLEVVFDVERAVLSGELLRERVQELETAESLGEGEAVQISGAPAGSEADERAVQISGARDEATAAAEAGKEEVRRSGPVTETDDNPPAPPKRTPAPVTLRLRVRRDVHLFWRALERAHARLGAPGSFASFLTRSFWATWLPYLGKSDRWEDIYRRDRYRCTSPVCFRRDCTLHHRRYGTDDPEDWCTECGFCHLGGEHEGCLCSFPPASRPTWLIGRTPILEVCGRDKRALR